MNSNDTVLLVPEWQQRYSAFLLPGWTQASVLLGSWKNVPNVCVVIQPNATVHFSALDKTAPPRAALGATFRAAAWAAAGFVPPARPAILLVLCANNRVLQNGDAVCAALRLHFPSAQLLFYFGNETLAETVRLFASADAVVAFHGAALANTVFCPPGALVVEVSLYANGPRLYGTGPGQAVTAGAHHLWRTNVLASLYHDSLVWSVYALRVEPAALPDWGAYVALNDTADVDSWFQYMPLVRIPESDLLNILNLLHAHFRTAPAKRVDAWQGNYILT